VKNLDKIAKRLKEYVEILVVLRKTLVVLRKILVVLRKK
jgi:hypothetical protein